MCCAFYGPLLFGIRAGSTVSVEPVEIWVECTMSSSKADEVGGEEVTQDLCEQRIVGRFDYFTTRGGPQRGNVILRFLGFGVVTIVGIDPEVARIGDISVEVAHNGFHTRAEVWLRVRNGANGWASISQLQTQYYYITYLA
jgi:hypothetical protein